MRILLLLASLWLVLAKAPAQSTTSGGYIPTPEAFFPDYGKAFLFHHQLVDYFYAVAAASPRVQVEQYGSTYEGRPLILAYVSSETNIAQLEQLRSDHLARSGVTQANVTDPAAKAVVWLSYSVHGNETAGSEASPSVLYAFATAMAGDSLAGALDNTVVVMDPSLNPDGYTRYTDDQRRRATRWAEPAPSAWEHLEPWPRGRTNHYMFDLNRDWVWASQTETQARLAAYQRWMPHVHADLHEMGTQSSYYFAPAAEPFHDYITDFQRQFQTEIGQNHARIFDANGWLYYTRETFDLLYPSYGDTYPTFSGAIGMTYEQAGGAGSAGRAYLRRDGDTLTLADRIAHHRATSLSTVMVASRNADRLAAQTNTYRQNARQQRRGDFEAYMFPIANNASAKLAALTALLDRHQITYCAASASANVSGRTYTGTSGQQRVQQGDLVVPARQIQGVLAQVLLDPDTKLPDSLTYDITAWSLPLVFGVDGFASSAVIADLEAYSPATLTAATQAPAYGFVVPMEGLSAWSAVAPLLYRGAVTRYTSMPGTVRGDKVSAGSLLVLERDQPKGSSAYRALYDSMRLAGLAVRPLAGGMATSGSDAGSDAVGRITAPTVALLQDDGANSNAFGHVWHFFERRLGYPIRPLPLKRLSSESLSDVDVLIIVDGDYALTGKPAETLEAWVRGGGRLIAMEDAAEAVGRLDGFALKDKENAGLVTKSDSDDPLAPFIERQRANIASQTPGALIEAQVDRTHPIAFGLGQTDFYVLRTANRPWAFLEDGGVNVVGVREEPTIQGFVGAKVQPSLEETLSLGVQYMGQGDVIYAADNLAYRGFWEQGMQLLANAVFYR